MRAEALTQRSNPKAAKDLFKMGGKLLSNL